MDTQALVIGAGISGLVCTYALRKSGIDAQLLEASPRPGGVIHSASRDGFLLELGPQSFSGTPALRDLTEELGLSSELLQAPEHAPRYVLIDGRLQPAPLSPPAFFLSSMISGSTKWALLRDIFGKSTPPASDESVATFIRRKFSPQLLDRLVGPFVSGVYAGDPERLSVRSAFPQLYDAEKAAGSIVRGMMKIAKTKKGPRERPTLQTFRQGNETLVHALAAKLGPALHCGVEVVAVQQGAAGNGPRGQRFTVDTISNGGSQTFVADHLVLATPTAAVANLLQKIHPEFARALMPVEYAPVAIVSVGYPKAAVGHSLEGFGFLVPRSEGRRILGTVWNSSLFPGRAPADHALVTSFVGGAIDPQAVALPTQELVDIVHQELAQILGLQNPPVFSNVQIYQRAIPQYNLGHGERLAALDRVTSYGRNLWLVGNYLRGPAIGACVDQALDVAERLGKTSG